MATLGAQSTRFLQRGLQPDVFKVHDQGRKCHKVFQCCRENAAVSPGAGGVHVQRLGQDTAEETLAPKGTVREQTGFMVK